MSTDNTTPGLGLPLPDAGNALQVDVLRLIAALSQLDTAWVDIQTALGNKQPKTLNLDKLSAIAMTAGKVFATDTNGDPQLVAISDFVRDTLFPGQDPESIRMALELTSAAITSVQASKTDATAGSLQIVGAFGGPDHSDSRFFEVDSQSDDTDWNSLTQKGLHKASLLGTSLNGPGVAEYFYVNVLKDTTDSLTQVAWPKNQGSSNIYIRSKTGAEWPTTWVKVLTAPDLVYSSSTQAGLMSPAQWQKLESIGTMAMRNLTISTSDPTGGNDGDVHFKIEA